MLRVSPIFSARLRRKASPLHVARRTWQLGRAKKSAWGWKKWHDRCRGAAGCGYPVSIAGHFHGKKMEKWWARGFIGTIIWRFMRVELEWNQQNWESQADDREPSGDRDPRGLENLSWWAIFDLSHFWSSLDTDRNSGYLLVSVSQTWNADVSCCGHSHFSNISTPLRSAPSVGNWRRLTWNSLTLKVERWCLNSGATRPGSGSTGSSFFLGELCMALFGYILYIQYTCIMYIDLSTEWDSTNGNFRLKKQQIPWLFLVSTIKFSWRPFWRKAK